MSFALEHLGSNLWRGKFSTFDENICQHAFSARLGGASAKPYKGLNMALHVGDEADIVWENRQRFFQALELKAEKLVTPQQVHGANIRKVTMADAGRGAKDYADAIVDSAKLQQERVFKIQVNDVNIRLKMLIGGEIDAVLLTEPQATLAREAHHQLLLDSRRLDIQFGAIALREVLPGDTLRQRQVEVLKKGYNQACDSLSAYGLKHYANILSKHYKLREDQLDSLILSMKFAKIAEPREADIERARKWLNQ